MNSVLPKLKRIPIKDRVSVLFLEYGCLDVIDGACVLVDKNGVRTHVPIGNITCLMLEPGMRVSHAAITLASRVGCLLMWVGEAGVRLYSSGSPGGARSDRLLYQARLALDDTARLQVVRKMYELRFGEPPPERRSVEQLRGIEGQRVREMYRLMAQRYGVTWQGRDYDRSEWGGDPVNLALSSATACLYGITESAILAAGYSPAIGFIHSGKPLSFVYDIADLVKFETVVPVAFQVAGSSDRPDVDRRTRLMCRDAFRRSDILQRLIPLIEDVLAAGGLVRPLAPADCQPVAFSDDDEVDEE